MDKKELKKRLQEIKEVFGEWEYFENMEREYLEIIYEILEENNKGEKE